MKATISLIKGDGIGVDVSEAAMWLVEQAVAKVGMAPLKIQEIKAGALYFDDTGRDIEPNGEERAGRADAIFLGAIGLPNIRYDNGTEISPHLRLRERYQLYAGVRPVKAYANAPQVLSDKSAKKINFVIVRESTEGLFYSAAVHGRTPILNDIYCDEVLRITRTTTEKLHNFAFKLAAKRKERGQPGQLTCVDKANVFTAMAFFRAIFDEVASRHSDIKTGYNYVDAMALDLVRQPWNFDVLVMENMFGDILSDLAGGLVGGMGMAACGEIGDEIGLFQPAHGSAPDIMGQDKANPIGAILSGVMMLDYLAEKLDEPKFGEAAMLLDTTIDAGFTANQLRPVEFGGDMGTRAIANKISDMLK